MKLGFEKAAKDIRRLLREELPAKLIEESDLELTLEPFAVVEVTLHLRDDWPNCEIQWIASRPIGAEDVGECLPEVADLDVEHEFRLDIEIIGSGDDEAVPLYFKVSRYIDAIVSALEKSKKFVHFVRDAQLQEFGALQNDSSILIRRFTCSVITQAAD